MSETQNTAAPLPEDPKPPENTTLPEDPTPAEAPDQPSPWPW